MYHPHDLKCDVLKGPANTPGLSLRRRTGEHCCRRSGMDLGTNFQICGHEERVVGVGFAPGQGSFPRSSHCLWLAGEQRRVPETHSGYLSRAIAY